MTPEQARDIYWDAMGTHDWHESSGDRKTQEQAQIMSWEVVINAIRRDYQAENERLRQRVRDLEIIVMEGASASAR